MATFLALFLVLAACGDDDGAGGGDAGGRRDSGPPVDAGRRDAGPPPAASCAPAAGGGSRDVAAPELVATLFDRWQEGWLGSAAVADLDGDGTNEIVVPRANVLYAWHLDNSIAWMQQAGEGRIWASPVVGDLIPERPGLEVAVAARGEVYAWGADGTALPGFPVSWRDEMRSLAAGDIDGNGYLELVAVTSTPLEAGGQRDIVMAWRMDGSDMPGFPPNTTGAAGCDDACYVTGGYDQNIALGDVNGDGDAEIFATQDNAYNSLHDGDGRAFDAAPIFEGRTKFLGIRGLHDYALAQMGWAPDEDTANQAHYTNTAPAIADLDGDGSGELIFLASVQNAAQTDRFRGVALWVLRPDGTRPDAWLTPFHAPEYLAGLWDFDGTNVVGATNQVSVAEIDPARDGPEMIFAGFDGRIHAVDARAAEIWSHAYTTDDRVLTGGVLVVDLSGDGAPEIVFNTYSPDEGKSALIVLDGGGNPLHSVDLPGRGAMPVPTVADVDGDEANGLEIVVSLKDAVDREQSVLIFRVASARANCLLWPTGRGSFLRSGEVRRE